MSTKFSNDTKKKITIGIIILLIALIVLLIILLNRKTQYEVSFDSNGGTMVASIIIDENGLAIKPEDPTRENHIFAGWYYNDELFNFSTPITGDIELEARWVEIGRVDGVTLDKNTLTLNVGDKAKLNATVTPEDASDKTITWESSNPDVVSVDADGNIQALKEGTATITVTTKDGEFVAKAVITVNKLDEKEEVVDTNQGTTNTDKEETKQPTNTDKEPNKPSKPNKPSQEETTVKVTGVSLSKTSLSLYINESAKLTATVKPNNATNKKITWASSDSSIATVDSNGNVKALKEGTATITVTTEDGSHKASCNVTVSKKPDNYVVTFTAIPLYENGPVAQYSVAVTKNGNVCDYKHVIYNGEKLGKYPDAEKLATKKTTATVRLTDGTDITATVVFK